MMRLQRPSCKEIRRKPLQDLRLGAHRLSPPGALSGPLRPLRTHRHKSLFHNNLCSSLALEVRAQKGRRFLLIPRPEAPITGLET